MILISQTPSFTLIVLSNYKISLKKNDSLKNAYVKLVAIERMRKRLTFQTINSDYF